MVARAQLTLRARPHVPSGFRRQDELVTIRPKVGSHHSAEVLFGGAIWRPVVVGEVKVCDALVEGVVQHFALHIKGPVVAEVVPQAERDRRQHQARFANAAKDHMGVAIRRGLPRIQGVWHTLVIDIDAHASHPSCAPSGPAPVRRRQRDAVVCRNQRWLQARPSTAAAASSDMCPYIPGIHPATWPSPSPSSDQRAGETAWHSEEPRRASCDAGFRCASACYSAFSALSAFWAHRSGPKTS